MSDFSETWDFLNIFSKNTQISDLMKVRPMGAELFNTDGQMETNDEVTVAFRNFANAPKKINPENTVKFE